MSDVMTAPVKVVHADTCPSEALSIMATNRFRHLPIVGDGMKLDGMLSLSRVLYWVVEDQSQELKALDAYLCADGPGG
jgi:CBS-domain-containing membrane protein